jgi:hypothetical protein
MWYILNALHLQTAQMRSHVIPYTTLTHAAAIDHCRCCAAAATLPLRLAVQSLLLLFMLASLLMAGAAATSGQPQAPRGHLGPHYSLFVPVQVAAAAAAGAYKLQ